MRVSRSNSNRPSLAACALLMLVACDGGGGGALEASGTVGVAGGRLGIEGGPILDIPQGALHQDVEIAVAAVDHGFPDPHMETRGPIYELTPHGQTFDKPVTLRVPRRGHGGMGQALYIAQPGDPWVRIADTRHDDTELVVTLDHFSFLVEGREICGLSRQECCDGACEGTALRCVDDICFECGQQGDVCCDGDTCAEIDVVAGLPLTCLETEGLGYCGFTSKATAPTDPMPPGPSDPDPVPPPETGETPIPLPAPDPCGTEDLPCCNKDPAGALECAGDLTCVDGVCVAS